jgi:DNA-binding XRE family transcriptional regulator
MPRNRNNTPRHFDAETFGQFIKTVREGQGRNITDIAREADVNRQAMYNLERGANLPSIRTIEAVST